MRGLVLALGLAVSSAIGAAAADATVPSTFYGSDPFRSGRAAAGSQWLTGQTGEVDVLARWDSKYAPYTTVYWAPMVVDAPGGDATKGPLVVGFDGRNVIALAYEPPKLNQKWSIDPGTSAVAQMAVLGSPGRAVAVALANGNVMGLEPLNNELMWLVSGPSGCIAAKTMLSLNASVLAAADIKVSNPDLGALVAGFSCPGTQPLVRMIDGGDGSTIWTSPPLQIQPKGYVPDLQDSGPTLALLPGGVPVVLIADTVGVMRAFSAANGTLVWNSTYAQGPTDASPPVFDTKTSTVWISGEDRELYSVNVTNGETTGMITCNYAQRPPALPTVGWPTGLYDVTALWNTDRIEVIGAQQSPFLNRLLSVSLQAVVPGSSPRFSVTPLLFSSESTAAGGAPSGEWGVIALSNTGDLIHATINSQGQRGTAQWALFLTPDRQHSNAEVALAPSMALIQQCPVPGVVPSGPCVVVTLRNGSVVLVGRARNQPLPTPLASPSPAVSPSPSPNSQPDGNNGPLVVGLSVSGAIVGLAAIGACCYLRRRKVAEAGAGSFDDRTKLSSEPASDQYQGMTDDRAAWE